MIGRIIWFSAKRGFGFILGESDGKDQAKDYFFHASDILSKGELKAKDKVTFDLGERNGRVKAINVNVVVNGG